LTSKKAHTSALQEKAGISQPESINSQSVEHIQHSRKIQPSAEELVQGIIAGNITALSRAITLVESTNPIHLAKANTIINSVKICDPAVGSGHFLVSALNEMIAIKHDLKVLVDREGKRLKEYQVDIVNDELIVTDEDGVPFTYNPKSKESQRLQETLFHEKQTIIENCLFGVDINPNSVKICRLRLWIELLKNAYYRNETELETLPNIDINIKCGNSLIARFGLDADLKEALKTISHLEIVHLAISVEAKKPHHLLRSMKCPRYYALLQ
jgi:hypothetical protein